MCALSYFSEVAESVHGGDCVCNLAVPTAANSDGAAPAVGCISALEQDAAVQQGPDHCQTERPGFACRKMHLFPQMTRRELKAKAAIRAKNIYPPLRERACASV